MDQPGNGIKMVDAEPQTAANQASSMNANALLNNTLDGFANLSSRFNPFAQKLNKGLGQVRQVRISIKCYLYLYLIIFYSMLKKNWVQLKMLPSYLKSIRI